MRRFLAVICVVLSAQTRVPAAHRDSVVLVRGAQSLPSAEEGQYAERLTRRMSEWLSAVNIGHSVMSDGDLSDSSLRGKKVAILVYNALPTARHLAELKSFLRNGGKLIVFYSSDPRLARMMDMRLGSYQAESIPGQWSAMEFTDAAPAHIPALVRQHSRNIRPCYPSGGNSSVISWWVNSDGERGRDPAWVQSDMGFWMSHVLLDDGDFRNKQLMLAGLIAALDPSIRRNLAEFFLKEAPRLGKYSGMSETVSAISTAARSSPRRNEIMALTDSAKAAYDDTRAIFRRGQFGEVPEKAIAVQRLLERAYAMTQSPGSGEFRGVWDHSPEGLYPGDWEKTCAILAEHGITDLLPNVAWGSVAHFASDRMPRSRTYHMLGDQLAQCAAAARKHGIRVHAWKVCWKLNGTMNDTITQRLLRQGRLQVSDSGQPIAWLCPTHPDNVKLEASVFAEMAEKYDIDGVHMDYIRFNNAQYCFCGGCRQRFESHVRRKVEKWPDDAINGPMRDLFRKWRADKITKAVSAIAAESRRAKPGIVVSAAVYGGYPSCIVSVGQDWALWLRDGHVDMVFPMNYTDSMREFESLLERQQALPHAGRRIIPGIGVTSSNSRLGPVETIDQIRALRRIGFAGFALFELNNTLEADILPLLSEGITAPAEPARRSR